MTLFLRLLDVKIEDKAAVLRHMVRNGGAETYEVDSDAFARIPASPFAYWASDRVLESFDKYQPFECQTRAARQGGVNGDDFRWLRLWTEIQQNTTLEAGTYLSIAKGGAFARFYGQSNLVVRWDHARKTFWSFTGLPHRPSLQPASFEYYFRPGLTWPRRTQSGLGMRAMPGSGIFADKGPAAFVEGNDPNELLALLAICVSLPFRYLVDLQMAFGSYEVGVIQRTPIPALLDDDRNLLAQHSRLVWSLKRMLDAVNETSHAFILPAPVLRRVASFAVLAMDGEIARVEAEIDDIAFRLYGLDGDDCAAIETWGRGAQADAANEANADLAGDSAGDDDLAADETEALLSWAVGIAFGRFDIRLATGEREIPPEPDPFDPLPAKSPGMIPEGDPPFMPCQGILVDDAGHTDDLVAHVTAVYELVGESAPGPDVLRRSLSREFFTTHVKMYSKSWRKAPIYWQLATRSASYSIWLYIHAFSNNTLFRVQNDYATPKLVHEQRQLEGLRMQAGPNPSRTQRKAIEAQEAFVEELQAFLEEVKRIAPLWNPELDDGVVINFAPLWRLVPQDRAWQRELRTTWDALCEGNYDWAHLAMHLWPERVVPKCATDRSLAIAHELEDVFWFEDEDGKWKPRTTPGRPIDDLVRERTSSSVKAALKSLLEAPEPAGVARRSRNGRAR